MVFWNLNLPGGSMRRLNYRMLRMVFIVYYFFNLYRPLVYKEYKAETGN